MCQLLLIASPCSDLISLQLEWLSMQTLHLASMERCLHCRIALVKLNVQELKTTCCSVIQHQILVFSQKYVTILIRLE